MKAIQFSQATDKIPIFSVILHSTNISNIKALEEYLLKQQTHLVLLTQVPHF